MAQIELQLGKKFASLYGDYRVVADTKPEGRDYQDGDLRTIEYLEGELKGQKYEQIFKGPSNGGGWCDL